MGRPNKPPRPIITGVLVLDKPAGITSMDAVATVRRKAAAGVLNPDNLIEEYVEDWIEASAVTEPIHRALEHGIDAIRKREAGDLRKKKRPRRFSRLQSP